MLMIIIVIILDVAIEPTQYPPVIKENQMSPYTRLIEARTIAIANGIEYDDAREALDLAEGEDVIYVYHTCSEAPVLISRGNDGVELLKQQPGYDPSDECWECTECQELVFAGSAALRFERAKRVSEVAYRQLMGKNKNKPGANLVADLINGMVVESKATAIAATKQFSLVNYIPDISFNLPNLSPFTLEDAIAAMDFKSGVEAFGESLINDISFVGEKSDKTEAWLRGYEYAAAIADKAIHTAVQYVDRK